MKNFVHEGDTLDLVLTADVESGGVVVQGSIAAIATKAGKAGDVVACRTKGVFDLPYGTATAIATGDRLYWDGAKVAKTATDNKLLGHATEARAASAPTARVKLIPVA